MIPSSLQCAVVTRALQKPLFVSSIPTGASLQPNDLPHLAQNVGHIFWAYNFDSIVDRAGFPHHRGDPPWWLEADQQPDDLRVAVAVLSHVFGCERVIEALDDNISRTLSHVFQDSRSQP